MVTVFRRVLNVTILLALLLSQSLGCTIVSPGLSTAPLQEALQAATAGIWLSPAEIACLPMAGVAWDQVKAAADTVTSAPSLRDQDSLVNVYILAKALVYARTGQAIYRDEVVAALQVITFQNTEQGGRTLALGRELAAYVIAADLVQLARYQPAFDRAFRQKLRELLDQELAGDTLRTTHERRPNNWGTHAGASRAAIAVYLDDPVELARTATVFRGWLGDLAAYRGFDFGRDLSWQADPGQPVAVNPVGAMKAGHSIDGALPEEMRRGGAFRWPPKKTNYAWGALQGAIVQAEILHRAGYPSWDWQARALLRAVEFLKSIDWLPSADDRWQAWLINAAYGQPVLPTKDETIPGKNMGWTNWTHRGRQEPSSHPCASQSNPTPRIAQITYHFADGEPGHSG